MVQLYQLLLAFVFYSFAAYEETVVISPKVSRLRPLFYSFYFI